MNKKLKRNLPGFLAFSLLLAAPALLAQDPGDPGPLAVTRAEYDFGNVFRPPGWPGMFASIEVTASVHYPTDLSGGPFPLVVFLHGRHATCYLGASAFLQWPCTPPREPIPSYIGYDYAAQILASHGYIVVSISANGINAVDNNLFDLGMIPRAQLIQHHLDRWNTWNTAGAPPFGDLFVGKVDLQKVGTMGHSRGGEGVAEHYVFNADAGSPYGVRAVLPLAPVNFRRALVNDVPLEVILPYCDGDVADLQGVHFFDDARYVPGDPAAKHTAYIMGGNHNFYNTIWTPGGWPAGTADDWLAFVPGGSSDPHCGTVKGNQRLTPEQQRGTLRAYMTGFFRLYIGGETAFAPIFKGDVPPPPSAMTTQIFSTYHAPDLPAARRDVNRLLNAANLATNTLGGAVTQTGLTPYNLCGGEIPQPRHCLAGQPNSRQPHTTPSFHSSQRGLSQLRLGWDDITATYLNDLPASTGDVSGFAAIQFRAGLNFTDTRNPVGMPRDFSVTLTDGAGNSATSLVSASSGALFFPPGGPAVIPVPKVFLNGIRLPLSLFSGVDLTSIQSVRFNFDQQLSGALLLSDIAFAD